MSSLLYIFDSRGPAAHRRRVFWAVAGAHLLVVLLTALSTAFNSRPRPPTGIRVRLVALQRPVPVSPATGSSGAAPPPHKKKSSRPRPHPVPPPRRSRPTAWRPRSAADIRRTARLSSAERRPRTVPALPSVSPDTIAGRIARKVNNLRLTVPGGGSTSRNTEAFFSALSAVLYRLWRQPDRTSVGSGRPTVHASVTVDASGRLLAVRLTGPSGIPAMDESVRAALARINRLPAPRDFGVPGARLTVEIAFELD